MGMCVCGGGAHTRMHVCIYMRWASLWEFMQIGNKPLHPFICARASAHARVCSDPLRRTVRWHSQMAHSYGESRDALWSCARVAHVMTYSRRGARSVTLDHWIGPAMPCKWQRLCTWVDWRNSGTALVQHLVPFGHSLHCPGRGYWHCC